MNSANFLIAVRPEDYSRIVLKRKPRKIPEIVDSNTYLRDLNLHPVSLRWTPHPVIVTIRDNANYIRVLLYSYYTTITGWGVLLMYLIKMPTAMPAALNFPGKMCQESWANGTNPWIHVNLRVYGFKV